MNNSTENEIQKTAVCTTGLYETHQKIFLSALNSTLAITAFVGNLLIIVALQRVSSLHPPSNLLLGCLASTDLCVGLIAQPLHIAFLTSPDHSIRCFYLNTAFNGMAVILGGVSLLTITAISVDRLLALVLGLRYRQVVTLRRTRIFIIISWIPGFMHNNNIPLYNSLNVLLHEYLFHVSPSTSSSTRPSSSRRRERRANATKYITIQKDIIQCFVGTDNISGLLSSLCNCSSYICNQETTHTIS